MKLTIIALFCAIFLYVTVIFTSCAPSSDKIARIVEERDSLRTEMRSKERQLANLDTLVSVINHGLDSIAVEEGAIFVTNGERQLQRDEILKKVETLQMIIENQKQRISNLEKEMAEQQNDGVQTDAGMASLLAHVKAQLAAKDLEIADLREQLQNKNVDIANLRQQVSQQSQRIAELDRRSVLQNEALKRQDAILNQCYMVAAPKKVLEQKGIIKKGRIVPQTALDRSKFAKVDIRKFNGLTFEGKKPKILTAMPSSSYTLITDGNGNFSLTITDASAFWSVSNYLVIQTN